MTSTIKEIKVDVTISEKIIFLPAEIAVLKSHDEFSDLPEGEKIRVYSLPEIAIEKTVALLDRARTEPRDSYDLWYLTEQSNQVDLADCLEGISKKLDHRCKNPEEVPNEFDKKEARLKTAWGALVKSLQPRFIVGLEPPSYEFALNNQSRSEILRFAHRAEMSTGPSHFFIPFFINI